MIKHTKKNITRKLLIGFIAVNTIFFSFGIISLIGMNKLSELTRKLYDHPLVVSNASLQANVGIIKMHSSMKDVALLGSQSAINTAIDAVNVQEGFVL
jgi:methyl-accepting chemotaxis protein